MDGYFQSGERAYLVPTLFLDRGALHLEPRYNYEDFDTGSLFAGWPFTFGDEGRYAKLTPMLGAVFGNLNGVAPGLEVEARWGRVAYWLESEYLFDLADSSGNYLYTWSELKVYATDWLWLGASLERMKVVQTTTEPSVGPMVGVGKPGRWSLAWYLYGLTEPAPEGSRRGGARIAGRVHVGGVSGTLFWVEPREELVGVFLTTLSTPEYGYHRRVVKQLVDAAIE